MYQRYSMSPERRVFMEIKNYTAAVNAYRFNADNKPKVRADKAPGTKANTDKAEFSSASRASFADSMKAAARKAADSPASPERLRAISAAIENGTYEVSAEEVAASIIGM